MTNKREIRKQHPPKWIDRVLEWFCSDHYLEEVQGDVHEWFYRRARRSGFARARLLYFYDVITYFRLFRIKKLNDMENSNNLLFFNYVKMCIRQYRKNTTYTTLNLLGLTVGILSTMFIAMYILDELSFDKFHEDHENIYRIVNQNPSSGYKGDSAPSPWKSRMAGHFPEILDHTRFGWDLVLVDDGESNFLENRFFWTDENFLNFFSFEVLAGEVKSMLTEPNAIVLTRSKALRYFGSEDVIGKTLPIRVYDGNKDFLMKVTGLIEDLPGNSHLQFDFLGSMATTNEMYGEFDKYWGLNWLQSYIKLPADVDMEALEAKIPSFFEEYRGEGTSEFSGMYFQPLWKVRLFSKDIDGDLAKGDINYIYLFGFVAMLVMLAASINYVNLTTAKSTKRGKEVGMRKVFGAVRGQVIRQFYVECAVQLVVAFALAIGLGLLLLPLFSGLVEKDLVYSDLFQIPVLLVMGGVFLVILLLSGFYPGLVMNRFRPIQVLRGNLLGAVGTRSWVRKAQVLVQFSIATFLISSTVIVVSQMRYFQNFDMGFDSEQLINIPVDDRELQARLTLIKDRMATVPGVAKIAASGEALPSAMNNTWGYSWPGKPEDRNAGINIVAIDYDFFDVVGSEIVIGRNISKEFPSDSSQVVLLNESAFALTEWEDIEEKKVSIGGNERQIAGVVKDFHYNSLHSKVAPCAYLLVRPGARISPDNLILRVETTDLSATMDDLDRIWREFSNQPFDFSFVDQAFAQLYGDEERFMQVVISFAAIGVFIAILGLVSLISFVAERQSKEISIRKVLGASRKNILSKVSGQFIQIFVLAILLALPLSRLAMERWLMGFENQVEVNWMVFATAAGIALAITLLSVGMQAMKVATSNPTRYLSDN